MGLSGKFWHRYSLNSRVLDKEANDADFLVLDTLKPRVRGKGFTA